MCAVSVCARMCVCYMATAAATQRLNLFSTKLNHQKFANNNAGVIYLTHGIAGLFRKRLPQPQQQRQQQQQAASNATNNNVLQCTQHGQKRKTNQNTHSI